MQAGAGRDETQNVTRQERNQSKGGRGPQNVEVKKKSNKKIINEHGQTTGRHVQPQLPVLLHYTERKKKKKKKEKKKKKKKKDHAQRTLPMRHGPMGKKAPSKGGGKKKPVQEPGVFIQPTGKIWGRKVIEKGSESSW